jgi:hypothetical protein
MVWEGHEFYSRRKEAAETRALAPGSADPWRAICEISSTEHRAVGRASVAGRLLRRHRRFKKKVQEAKDRRPNLRSDIMATSANAANIVNRGITRSIFRWIHIICGIPILGYIYDSPSDTHNYAFSVRYVFLPVLLLSGLWMWKGHLLRRLISKRSAKQDVAAKLLA